MTLQLTLKECGTSGKLSDRVSFCRCYPDGEDDLHKDDWTEEFL